MCDRCGHELGWHGDRAIAACDGGYGGMGLMRLRAYGDNGPVALCNCPGWVESPEHGG